MRRLGGWSWRWRFLGDGLVFASLDDAPRSMISDPRRVSTVEQFRQRFFAPLDGLRAVAAWMVVVYHFGWWWMPGSYGVVLFFVLSGFLITLLLLREAETTGTISFKNFYIRRALRIMPAFYVYVAVMTGWYLLRHKPVNVGHLTAALTYTINYYNAIWGDPNTGYSHAWSLAIEEQFYFIWPITMWLLLRRQRLFRTVLTYIIATWVIRAALVATHRLDQGYFYSALEMRADALMVGAMLAIVLHRYPEALARRVDAVGGTRLIGVGVLLAAGLATAEFFLGRKGIDFRDSVSWIVLPVLCAGVILGAISAQSSPLGRFLSSRGMTWLGKLSYSTYLYQQFLVPAGRRVFPNGPDLLQFAATVAAVLVAAAASYYLVEHPLLRLKDRFAVRSANRAPATAFGSPSA